MLTLSFSVSWFSMAVGCIGPLALGIVINIHSFAETTMHSQEELMNYAVLLLHVIIIALGSKLYVIKSRLITTPDNSTSVAVFYRSGADSKY